MSSPHSEPPPLRDYEVLQLISMRAGATIYAGRQRFTGQVVAVHLLDPAQAAGEQVSARLVTAARRAAQVNDPAVVATYDVIAEPGALGVVTEPIEGAWLDEMIRPGTPLPPAVALAVLDAVLGGLETAHRSGVVHGRIAADVVLVTLGGQPRLGGFATTAALVGEDSLDVATDLWYVAVLAHFLLTGTMPNSGDNVPAPSMAGLSDILDRALAADPQARYQSAAELRTALVGAAFTALGPAWRLSSDLTDRVVVAMARRPSPVSQPGVTASLVGPEAAAAVRAALDAERAASPAAGPIPGFRTPPPPGSAVLAGATAPPMAQPPSEPPRSYLPPPPPHPAAYPVASPDEGHRSRIILAVAGAVLVIGGIITAVVVLLTRSSSTPLSVGSDVKLDIKKVSAANCDNTFNFDATGSLTGTGTLIYHFERSDGQRTDDMKVQIDGNPGFDFSTSWRFIGQRTGHQTMTFVITAPTTRQVNRDFDTTCP